MIREEVNQTIAAFLEKMSTFNKEEFNTVPFKGSWTAGQVAEHVRLSCGGMAEMLWVDGAPTERQPDELVAMLKREFLDFTTRMQSPEEILPAERIYDPQALTAALSEIATSIDDAARSLDLTQTCTAFEFPGVGNLTRLEMLWFVVVHTQRHLHQLTNIRKALSEK